MDILNWIYLKREQLIRRKANNPDTDLVALGADVGFNKRDDQYQTYAMPLKDFVEAGNEANTAHYELDITTTSVVTVSTPRGIIDILGMGSSVPLTPDAAYATSVPFYINNPDLNLTAGNRDNIYVQYSVYYNQAIDDNVIPHLIATGATPLGLGFNLYNANPAVADTANWTGALYVYYELYTIN
jgi:hypothetical protein